MKGYTIEIQIYADSEEEAEQGRTALISFIEKMRMNGVAVRGAKLLSAVSLLDANQFIKRQIINFFR